MSKVTAVPLLLLLLLAVPRNAGALDAATVVAASTRINIWDMPSLRNFAFLRGGAKFLNRNLINCLCASKPKTDDPTGCEKTLPSDPVAAANTALYPTDDCLAVKVPDSVDSWNDRLFNAAGVELTGVYGLDGHWCGGPDATPSKKCPVQVRAAYETKCSTGTDRCMVAQFVAVHYIIRQAVQVEGITTMKEVRSTMPLPLEVALINSR